MRKDGPPLLSLLASVVFLTVPLWAFSMLVFVRDYAELSFLGDKGWAWVFLALPAFGCLGFLLLMRLSVLSRVFLAAGYYPAALLAELLCGLMLLPAFS
jgi:hypothetical protein